MSLPSARAKLVVSAVLTHRTLSSPYIWLRLKSSFPKSVQPVLIGHLVPIRPSSATLPAPARTFQSLCLSVPFAGESRTAPVIYLKLRLVDASHSTHGLPSFERWTPVHDKNTPTTCCPGRAWLAGHALAAKRRRWVCASHLGDMGVHVVSLSDFMVPRRAADGRLRPRLCRRPTRTISYPRRQPAGGRSCQTGPAAGVLSN